MTTAIRNPIAQKALISIGTAIVIKIAENPEGAFRWAGKAAKGFKDGFTSSSQRS